MIVFIKRTAWNGNVDFEGKIIPHKPPGYNEKTFVTRDPGMVAASLVYGCFFQAVYLGTAFDACFDQKPSSNGLQDFGNLYELVRKFGLSDDCRDQVETCIAEQFKEIEIDQNLKALMKVSVDDLLHSDDDRFIVNPEELKKRIADFLPRHEASYVKFVEKLRMVFEPYLGS